MSKAFITESDSDDDEDGPEEADVLPAHSTNYMTPTGYAALREELRVLLKEERPKVVEVVAWAAGNGDRSENGDYLYGKKRLREIDRRIRYLTKRIDSAVVVDPREQQGIERVFFGATVTYAQDDDSECTVTLVGVDEADFSLGKISWISPVARALMKSGVGDVVELRTASGVRSLEIVSVTYRIDAE